MSVSQVFCILKIPPINQMFSYISDTFKGVAEAFLMIALPPSLLADGDLYRGENLSQATEFCQVFLRTLLLKGSTAQERLLTSEGIFISQVISAPRSCIRIDNGVCRDE